MCVTKNVCLSITIHLGNFVSGSKLLLYNILLINLCKLGFLNWKIGEKSDISVKSQLKAILQLQVSLFLYFMMSSERFLAEKYKFAIYVNNTAIKSYDSINNSANWYVNDKIFIRFCTYFRSSSFCT